MNPTGATPPLDRDDELSALVEVLSKTGQRLEELTAGEVDTVVDGDGRTLLLRGTQEQLRQSENAWQAEVLKTSLEEFRTLAEAMPQIVWITRPDGGNVYFNQQWMDYTGLTLEESLGHGWNKPFHPEDQRRAWDAWQQATATHGTYELECRLRRADGVYHWWLIRGVPYQDSTGTILKWFGTCTDIHDLKMLEEALLVEKESAQARLNSIGDAVVCTDTSGNINFLNSVAVNMSGCTVEEAAGRPMAEVLRIKDATGGDISSNLIGAAVAQGKTLQLPPSYVFMRHDGTEVPIEGSVAPIHGREGHDAGSIIVVRDVSAARAMSQQLVHLAEHDFLTGLPNRKLLNDRIGHAIELARRHAKSAALLFLDIDGFKHINDSLGHRIGDKLIQSVADRLGGCVRASDTVSREGGDEYSVLLSEVSHPEDTMIAVKRMMGAVATPHQIDRHELHVTTCIGVSVYPHDGIDAETLIKNADTAMYQAKENGRPSFQFFEPEMNVRAVERQSIEENLRRALERKEFALHYQPKINIKTGAIVGAEALLRWTHPVRGSVSPAQFIPVAEDSGLILPIGNWVLHEACRQARAWLDGGLPPMTIAVNVSGLQFINEGFIQSLFAVLDETRLDPKYLEVEITESILMKNVALTSTVLHEMREAGIKVALDDFGTGYSSLSYLYKFPIDVLKIDQSFVRQITAAPDQTSIVNAIIGMGQSLNLSIVAEGVETPEQLEFLRVRGCDEAQGYYFSRPVPAQQFAKLCRQSGL